VDPARIEAASSGNLKRTWINRDAPDWTGSDAEGRSFLDQATEVRTIWVPYGE
jgi:aldehyde dehydrogenase (NAD+)